MNVILYMLILFPKICLDTLFTSVMVIDNVLVRKDHIGYTQKSIIIDNFALLIHFHLIVYVEVIHETQYVLSMECDSHQSWLEFSVTQNNHQQCITSGSRK